MTDISKLDIAKEWIEKLANGINPLNDESVKEGDLINNVHISRCLFYVVELLREIKPERRVRRGERKEFFLSSKDAVNIPVSSPNGLGNVIKLVNGIVPADMKSLTAPQLMKWLRNEGLMQEVIRDDGRKTNHPTEKGQRLGINIVLERNLDGLEYQRVLYSVAAQRFILSNIESIASYINAD